MSEQFAIQPEEFDSTNERLDSILDRLNALSQSVAPTTTATKRSLESVPGITQNEPGSVITAPNDTEAASPPLGLVPPIVVDEPADGAEEIIDDAVDGEAFSDLEIVDSGADFESVTVVEAAASDIDGLHEPEAIDTEPVVVDGEFPPVDLEIPQTGWTEVGNHEFVTADPANEITDEDIAFEDAAFEDAALEEAADTEAVAAEVREADLFDAQSTIDIEPIVPPPIFETDVTPPAPVEQTLFETPDIFAPTPAEADGVADMAAVEQTPLVAPANEAPTEPIEIEFHEMELTPDPVAHIDAQVFDLGEADEADVTPSTLPDAPQSIFSSSLGSGTNKAEPVAGNETDGWVSHHGPSEQPASFAQVTGDSDTEITQTGTYDAASDPQWEIEPPISGSIFDQDSGNDVSSANTEITTEITTETAADPFDMANEVEQTLGELETFETTDPFAMGDAEAPMVIGGVDSSLVETSDSSFDVLSTGVDKDSSLYTSDDELPLPDFTGVYDGADSASASGSVESTISSSLSVGRHELDSLRPEEDPADSMLVADVQQKRDLSGIVQFSFVAFIGIAALVMYWVLDPTALADMRANLDNLLGR